MKHVDVLRDIRDDFIEEDSVDAADIAALTFAIDALSAPAEAQPVDGVVCLECGQPTMHIGQVCYSCLHPPTAPPSAPVGVEDESVRVGNLPTMNQDGYPGLGEWWVQLWRGDEIIARVYGDGPDEVRSQAQDIADALNQQPAACPKCGGTGEADSGGIMPWGAPAMIPCDCQQPAAVDEAMVERIAALLHEEATDEPWAVAGVEHDGPDRDYYRTLARKVIVRAGKQPEVVDDLNDWRAAFVAERAARYRESGMAIEQARIHAETDAALMETSNG